MLNFLVLWAEQLIIALIIIVMVEMIIPNSSYRKYIKVILGIFIIYTIFSPIISNKLNKIEFGEVFSSEIKNNTNTYNQTSIDYDKQIETVYKEKLKEALSEELKEKGYEIKRINLEAKYQSEEIIVSKLEMKISKFHQNENITINKVTITETENISKEELENLKKEISNNYNIDTSKISIESEKSND